RLHADVEVLVAEVRATLGVAGAGGAGLSGALAARVRDAHGRGLHQAPGALVGGGDADHTRRTATGARGRVGRRVGEAGVDLVAREAAVEPAGAVAVSAAGLGALTFPCVAEPMVALGVRGTRLAHGPRAQEDTPRRPALSVHVGRGSGQPARGPRGCAVRVAAAVVDAIALVAARTHAEPVTVVGAAVGVITAGLAALQRA